MKSTKKVKLLTLDKAISVLEIFLHQEEAVRLSEIARRSNLDKATVNRILSTFVNRGYLRQREKRGKYYLGMRFLDFCAIIKRRIKIRDIAMPYLTKLTYTVKESAVFSFSNTKYTCYNEVIPSNYPLTIGPNEGTTGPLYCTSVGKILLSAMSDKDIEYYLKSIPLVARTQHTILDPEFLKKQLLQVRTEGIAYDNEEYAVGIKSIAVGVLDREGNMSASVGIMSVSTRLTQSRIQEIIPPLKDCAAQISRALRQESR
ncbi:MAG: IclR family transcriptional regulator [Dehalococcoidales bacterium]|nr:IclR family transcriptional regulator [Dehalococcoidales bacterium]